MQPKPKAILPAVMTGLAFLAFLVVYWLLTARSVVPCWGAGLLFLFPAAVLRLVTVLTRRGQLSELAGNTFAVLLSVLFLLTSFVLLVVLAFRGATHPVTDPALYGRVLRLTEHKHLLTAFPTEIPPEAENVEFFYAPQLMQGAGEWELSYDAPEAEARQTLAEWEAAAIAAIPGADWDAGALLPESLRGQAGCTVYVFEAEPYHPDSWNHGKVRLAAEAGGRLTWYASVW